MYRINDIIKVEVVEILPFGAFVKDDYGANGLIHISQISDNFVYNISDYLKISQRVKAKIIGYNHKGKLSLSIKYINNRSLLRDRNNIKNAKIPNIIIGFETLRKELPKMVSKGERLYEN